MLGKCLEKMNKKDAALEAYKNSLQIDPKQNNLVIKGNLHLFLLLCTYRLIVYYHLQNKKNALEKFEMPELLRKLMLKELVYHAIMSLKLLNKKKL